MTDDVRLAIREAIKDAARAKSNNDYGLFLDDAAERVLAALQEADWRHVPEEGGPSLAFKCSKHHIWMCPRCSVEEFRQWLLAQEAK